ncbi:MAG: dehydrogenase [Dehalococcoides mccartyi]|uniref:PQQ-binding-like beta-propeller repeat protein n=1 Tax=Dehalococcoides mccartyi TaxID=61435 RepID=UPI000804F1CE|nr:PQQ-binding-like beta-propeller repeat protein [Dehalococcoides mccartyi]OBW62602.1 MAG: dehydrogenase [Dehalococcoides mccartyi]
MFKTNRISKKLILLLSLIGVLAVLSGCMGTGQKPLGWSGVVVSDNDAIFGSMTGKLIALNKDASTPRYQVPLETTTSGGGCAGAVTTIGIYGTPVISDGVIYISTYGGKIYAYNQDQGDLKWVYPVTDALPAIVSGIAPNGDKIFFADTNGVVYALSKADGQKVWEYPTGAKIWASPVVSGDLVIVPGFDKKVYALDINTGNPVWTFEAKSPFASAPVVDNGTVYVGCFDRNMYALDLTDGSQKWVFASPNWFWASPVIADGKVFAPNLDGNTYILDALTGTQLKVINMTDGVASSPALLGDNVIVATKTGKIFSINIYSLEMKAVTDLALKVIAPVTVSGEVVYIHTQEKETVYAINPESRTIIWTFVVS